MLGGYFLHANISEPRQGEVRRTPLSRIPLDNERLGSDLQTLTTPKLMFRALLMKDGTQRLELARTWRTDTSTYAL
jgi:hypothetical protein